MSGGYFDYKQFRIDDIADSIEQVLENQGKEIEDPWYSKEYLKEHPEAGLHHTYPEEVQEEFRNAIKYLRIAAVYAHRVDWLLSGDDGEDTFLERLKYELNLLNAK